MSDLLPYEKQLQDHWTEIPLPAENAAWEDMRKRLEEDDDRGFFFWWRPGCAWWGLFLVLIGLGWWMARSDIKPGTKDDEIRTDTIITADKHGLNRNDVEKSTNNGNPDHNKQLTPNAVEEPSASTPTEKTGSVKEGKPAQERFTEKNPAVVKVKASHQTYHSTVKNKTDKQHRNTTANYTKTHPFADRRNREPDSVTTPNTFTIDSATANPPVTTEPGTSTVATRKKTDSTLKTDTASRAVMKSDPKDSVSKQRIFFSTGLTMQQQLPIAGQKATPYSSTGRKSSLSDYIPSVYIRLNKKDKWFLQAEFRYGAPQYSKEFLYQQVSISDTGRNPRSITNTSVKLKKTFYHQLPLSFHYYVLPNWSVGGGVIWNKFYAAVSDKETVKHNNINQTDSVVFKGIVSTKKDTSGTFSSSFFHALVETQYQWKRFSIGARYAFGLQPYIRFTLPGVGTKEEKNTSIQAFLRFELWRSEREKKGK